MSNKQFPGIPKPRIVVCRNCNGAGKRNRIHERDTTGKSTTVTEEECPVCEGSGRLVSTLVFKPYKPGQKL